MERVGKTAEPGTNTSVVLRAARGEYEPFQVVVRAPAGGLSGVTLAVSDLHGTGRNEIASTNLARFREHYVRVAQSSECEMNNPIEQPLGTGWYADALIPFADPWTGKAPAPARFQAAPASISAGENQPYWVDLFVPRETVPGSYSGTYTVASDQGLFTGQIALQVWNFEIPARPSAAALVTVWTDKSLEAKVLLLQHRLAPGELTPAEAGQLARSYGLAAVDLGFWSGADYNHRKMSAPPPVEEIRAKAANYPKGCRLLNFTADELEAAPELNDSLRRWGANLHKAGVAQLLVAPPVAQLFDDGTGKPAVDVWVLQRSYYDKDPALVAEGQRRGMEFWSYTALNQDGWSPKWLLDFAPVNYRVLPGFLNQSLGFKGIFYWAADYWLAERVGTGKKKRNPWLDPHYRPDKRAFPGEGYLVYPGQDASVKGTVPSLRLKWIRKGMEDYEYVELLNRAGKRDLALQLSQSVAKDWKTWSRVVADYEKARRQIADAILSASANP